MVRFYLISVLNIVTNLKRIGVFYGRVINTSHVDTKQIIPCVFLDQHYRGAPSACGWFDHPFPEHRINFLSMMACIAGLLG